jgi:hypothetical protein
VGPTCAVQIGREELQFAVNEGAHGTESLYMFATLEPRHVFEDFRVESRAGNEIAFTIVLDNLVRALQSGRAGGGQMVLKLTMAGGQPHLSLETVAHRITVQHDIPITLIKVEEMCTHYPPKIDDPDVQIEMAPPQSLRHVIGRMKALHTAVWVRVDVERRSMEFSVETDNVTLKTFYHDLAPEEAAGGGGGGGGGGVGGGAGGAGGAGGGGKRCSVKLNSRQLVRSLNFANMQSESTMCCITEGQAMQLHVHLWGDIGDISYVIPVLNDPDEEETCYE